jgi:ABC-type antimicrobial peptide transport system permease subunit
MRASADYVNNVHVAYDPRNTQAVIKTLEALYKRANPEFPFNFTFMDERFNNLYQTEQVTASLALGFTLMAIIISGLGMLGLAAYTTERKRKEISIRKTLGASVSGIVSMISMEFVKLSIVATLIGCPIAYFLMDKFLSTYVYHTPLHWTIFAYTSLAIFTITLLTVLFQVTKAALTNPVEALRSE